MESWKDKISNEVKALVDLDKFAVNYLNRIQENKAKGLSETTAVKKATVELAALLAARGVKQYEAVHLLHFCGMEIYPRMYNGCGCHGG